MQLTNAIFTTAVLGASFAAASPVLVARDMCNTSPTAATNANVQAISSPSVTTASACQAACNANAACKSFVFGLPAANAVGSPVCELFNVAASQVPSQGTSLNVFDKACTSVPTAAPTHDQPQGANTNTGATTGTGNTGNTGNTGTNTGANTGNTGANTGNTGNTGGKAKAAKRANQCSVAPTGPTSNNPTPLNTSATPTSMQECLQLCKQTTGCKS
jgi:hypothetical protein